MIELGRLSHNRNVLAALVEAALAALFLEHGFEKIEPAIVDAFSGRIEYAATTHVDFKTELQEQLAAMGQRVSYAVLEVEGPPHDRTFEIVADANASPVEQTLYVTARVETNGGTSSEHTSTPIRIRIVGRETRLSR